MGLKSFVTQIYNDTRQSFFFFYICEVIFYKDVGWWFMLNLLDDTWVKSALKNSHVCSRNIKKLIFESCIIYHKTLTTWKTFSFSKLRHLLLKIMKIYLLNVSVFCYHLFFQLSYSRTDTAWDAMKKTVNS